MDIDFTYNLEESMKVLYKQGAFLTVKNGEKVNTMTIGWGNIGFIWGKPVFSILVRESRYTHDFLEKNKEFSISIPFNNEFKEALSYCGSRSGKDVDKFKECKLKTCKGRKINTPIIDNCGMIYECKIIYKQTMDENFLNNEKKQVYYKKGDYHTVYYGEIVDLYLNSK